MDTNPGDMIPATRKAAQALENQLAQANPIGAEASQAVADNLTAVSLVLTALNQEEAALRSGQMLAVGHDLTEAVKKLTTLKEQLAKIASALGTVGEIASGLDTVLSGCKGIFGI
jgi:hypothetical protein